MNNQQIFDAAAKHLLTQNQRAAIHNASCRRPQCMYRTSDGLACAIGGIIPDDVYDPEMEHQTAEDLLVDFPRFYALFDHEDYEEDLLINLQNIHDANEPGDWPDALYELAVEFNLDPSIANTALPEFKTR